MGFWTGLKDMIAAIREVGKQPLQEIDEINYNDINEIAKTLMENAEGEALVPAIEAVKVIVTEANKNHVESQKRHVYASVVVAVSTRLVILALEVLFFQILATGGVA
ncbi:MAG: hypothetical protein JW839_02120 [Candidatus Lokiarchaeota archaeon]|nr:hypothetical protein [Candidatus Lokiarchaeota archaeon]